MDKYKILLEALVKNWEEIDVIDSIAYEKANSIMDRWSSFNGLEKEFTEELKNAIIDAIHQWNLFLEKISRET